MIKSLFVFVWLWLKNIKNVPLAFRNPKHRIVPAVALAGSSIPAFDDVNTKDPDFEYIQGKNRYGHSTWGLVIRFCWIFHVCDWFSFFSALAEAGITPSKLCGEDSRNSETSNFYPERWKRVYVSSACFVVVSLYIDILTVSLYMYGVAAVLFPGSTW